jgi:hypothetical protein
MFTLWELLPEKVLTPYQLLASLVRAQIGFIFKKEMEVVRSPRFEPGSSAWQAYTVMSESITLMS